MLGAYESWDSIPAHLENKKIYQVLKRKKIEGSDLEEILITQDFPEIVPTKFIKVFKSHQSSQLKWNKHCKTIEKVFTEEGYDTFALWIKPPVMFVKGRVFMDTLYFVDREDPDE